MKVNFDVFFDKYGITLNSDEERELENKIFAFLEYEFLGDYYQSGRRKIYANIINDEEFFQKFHSNNVKNCYIQGDLSRFNLKSVSFMNVQFHEDVVFSYDNNFFINNNVTRFVNCTLPRIDFRAFSFKKSQTTTQKYLTFSGCEFHPDTVFPDHGFSVNIVDCKMPVMDFNKPNVTQDEDVTLERPIFHKNTLFGASPSFFIDASHALKKWLIGCTLPGIDYRNYDFSTFDFGGIKFEKDAILPDDKNLFQKCFMNSICQATLPEADYSQHDFFEVDITGTIFSRHSILPHSKDFFQKISSKDITRTALPSGDFSNYDFSGVTVRDVRFTDDSVLPIDFLEQINKNAPLNNVKWPLQFIRDVFLINEPSFHLDLRGYQLPSDLLKLLHARYKNNSKVDLPSLKETKD